MKSCKKALQNAGYRETSRSGGSTTSVAKQVLIFSAWMMKTPVQADNLELRHSTDHTKYRTLPSSDITRHESLLVDIIVEGKKVHEKQTIDELRCLRQKDEEDLDSGVKRLINPHIYHGSLSRKLWDLKQHLINEAKTAGRRR